ncbi:MAG: hypothetical protein R3B57_00410 [Phycisphaerales bacterium]
MAPPAQSLWDVIGDGVDGIPELRTLIAAGADVNETRDHGYTLFMSAVGAIERDRRVLEALIEAGADPHAVSEYGYNAYHAALDAFFSPASADEARSILGYLHELGVNIEQRNRSGYTPLAYAIDRGWAVEVEVMCELGADVNALGPFRWHENGEWKRVNVPLVFIAIEWGERPEVMLDAMLGAGLNLDVHDKDGRTPYEYAVSALEEKLASGPSRVSDPEGARILARDHDERVATLRRCVELLFDHR